MTKTFSAGTRNGAKVFKLKRAMTKTFSAGTRTACKSFQPERAMTKTFSARNAAMAQKFSAETFAVDFVEPEGERQWRCCRIALSGSIGMRSTAVHCLRMNGGRPNVFTADGQHARVRRIHNPRKGPSASSHRVRESDTRRA